MQGCDYLSSFYEGCTSNSLTTYHYSNLIPPKKNILVFFDIQLTLNYTKGSSIILALS